MAKAKTPKEDRKKAAAKTAKTPQSQGNVPGTEGPEEIEELTLASEAYQKKIRERLAVAEQEADQKSHLQSVVGRLLENGTLKLNPAIPDGVKQAVYSYHDDNNAKRTVYAQRDQLKISVKVEKGEDE